MRLPRMTRAQESTVERSGEGEPRVLCRGQWSSGAQAPTPGHLSMLSHPTHSSSPDRLYPASLPLYSLLFPCGISESIVLSQNNPSSSSYLLEPSCFPMKPLLLKPARREAPIYCSNSLWASGIGGAATSGFSLPFPTSALPPSEVLHWFFPPLLVLQAVPYPWQNWPRRVLVCGFPSLP